MQIKVQDLHKQHALVQASHAMVKAYSRHETMVPALEEVGQKHPDLLPEQLISLWVGINASIQVFDPTSDMEDQLCQQLLKIIAALGFNSEDFDQDADQSRCMLQMAAAAADMLTSV